MSVLTVLTDVLLAGLLLWLIRRGAIAHARDPWGRAGTERLGGRPSLCLRLDRLDSLGVTHRRTARRWEGLRPCANPIVLGDGGDELRIERVDDGSVIVAAERGVVVMAIDAHTPRLAWPEGAPGWIVEVEREPSSSGRR